MGNLGEELKLPERINTMKVVTYYVESIVNSIVSLSNGKITANEITLEEVLDLVHDWADEDMSNPKVKIIFQDENGEEL
jgi:hypothetical protein